MKISSHLSQESGVRMQEFPPDEVREFLTKLSLVGTKNYSSDLK
ncbi:hypothetical protein [Sphaerospermopsis sp. FACHB-1194]|nr:hypothetical protein [Sphaerospermopsis sp. FACHB-1194]